MNMLWKGWEEISGNLSKQLFPTGSGRIILKTTEETIFISYNLYILGYRFLDVMVLIRRFLHYAIQLAPPILL